MRWGRHPKKNTKSKLKEGQEIALANLDFPVEFRRHPKARRLTLRVSAANGAAIVTAPPFCSDRETIAFLERHRSWLTEQIAQLPSPIPFTDGAVIPLRGAPHRISVTSMRRGKGVVWHATSDKESIPQLVVTGGTAHAPRRLKNWLRAEAKADLLERSHYHAERLGLKFNRIMIKDQRSRWGSCSSKGILSYSWRLILSPSDVLDYVAAHEVAHLKEMNHGAGFWRLVEQTKPNYKDAKQWLKTNGIELHRYGAETQV